MAFLELRTPRDMLEKARREHSRLSMEFDIDNVFNFFVTANHIRDYIQKTDAVSRDAIDEFCRSPELKDCRDLCDKAKHMRLTQRADVATHQWSGAFGDVPFNTLPLAGRGRWELWSDDRHVDVQQLANRVLDLWEGFFREHGL